MTPYLQIQGKLSTLDHWKQMLAGNQLQSLAAFAYVTDSGVAQVRTYLKSALGKSRACRWLFGFDYGRSHPTALEKLKEIGKSTIRIYDGEYVVGSNAFTPRTSFHLKTALTLQKSGRPRQQIVGSGNLSACGLLSGIEAGCVIDYSQSHHKEGSAVVSALEDIWDNSTPLEKVLNEYKSRYSKIIQPTTFDLKESGASAKPSLFWIDVGYVTKNRGEYKPGNQFDLPKGSHLFLGIKKALNPKRNSVLGDLKLRTPNGAVVERALRYGNNEMEKLTLPIPESHGYQCYDGKILTFRKVGGAIILEAFEHDDFFQSYGKHISSCGEMKSGRKYGTISLHT
jgi:HKD family nuclease